MRSFITAALFSGLIVAQSTVTVTVTEPAAACAGNSTTVTPTSANAAGWEPYSVAPIVTASTGNSTYYGVWGGPTATGAPSATSAYVGPEFTGAASRLDAGVALAGFAGLAAFFV